MGGLKVCDFGTDFCCKMLMMVVGMGFDLLVHFLAYIKPVTIFQLSVPKQSYGAGGKNLVDGFGGILENMIGEGSSGDFRIVNVDGVESER